MTKQYGFLIDMQNCYGCKTCSMACKSESMVTPVFATPILTTSWLA